MTRRPRAVLWDLDGTIADSKEFHWRAWRETMLADGVEITHEQFLHSFGQRNDAILEDAAAGIEAARRGGMQSVGAGGDALRGADVVVASLADLPSDVFERLVPAD